MVALNTDGLSDAPAVERAEAFAKDLLTMSKNGGIKDANAYLETTTPVVLVAEWMFADASGAAALSFARRFVPAFAVSFAILGSFCSSIWKSQCRPPKAAVAFASPAPVSILLCRFMQAPSC